MLYFKISDLKKPGQLRFSVGNVIPWSAFLAEGGDDVSEGEESEVDGHALLEASPGGLGFVGAFGSGQIDQMKLWDDAGKQRACLLSKEFPLQSVKRTFSMYMISLAIQKLFKFGYIYKKSQKFIKYNKIVLPRGGKTNMYIKPIKILIG